VVIKSLPILFFSFVFLSGCHHEEIKEPRPIDLVQGRIGGTWKVSEAVLDAVTLPDYEKGSVAFMESQDGEFIYFLTDGMPTDEYWPWPLSGTLKIGDDLESHLIFVETNTSFDYAIDDSQLMVALINKAPCVPREGEVCVEIMSQWVFTLTRDSTP